MVWHLIGLIHTLIYFGVISYSFFRSFVLSLIKDFPDLNTSRDWRKDPEGGITEDDIHAPFQHPKQAQDDEEHKKHHKHHHQHKGHHHHHHHKRKTSSSHSNRISPGGREGSLPNTPYLPNLPSEAAEDETDKAEYKRIPMDDWVKRWEGRKVNLKVVLPSALSWNRSTL